MKLLLSVVFAVTTFAMPSISVGSTSLAAVSCGPDAPEEWLRPGGYCDQIGSNNSLVPPDTGDGVIDTCVAWLEGPILGDRIHVALPYIPCGPCYDSGEVNWTDGSVLADRLRVAVIIIC